MQRREFIGLIGGGAAAWPFAAMAQQDSRIKLVGVFSSDGVVQARMEVFKQAMLQLGWSDGRNVRFDIRWGAGDPETNRKEAQENGRARARDHRRFRQLGRGGVAASNPQRAGRVR